MRRAGFEPVVERVAPVDFERSLVAAVHRELEIVSPGRVAVIVASARIEEIVRILTEGALAAVDPRDQDSKGLSADLVVLGAEGANGLEFDATLVVEPGEIARRGARSGESSTPRGLRTLYVAMTRPTRRLAILVSGELPETIR